MLGLRAARHQKGYSQEKLGVLSGLNARLVSEVERGLRILTPREQKKVAEALEMSQDDLLFGDILYEIDGSHEEFDPDIGFDDIDDDDDMDEDIGEEGDDDEWS